MKELQALVAKAVADRGYREGWTDEQFVARQICKAAEELGEAQTAILWNRWAPNWAGALQFTSIYARKSFDERLDDWNQVVGIDSDSELVASEFADIVIPILAAADVLGIDLESAIREKVLGDVQRGVRGEKPEEESQWTPLGELREGAVFESMQRVKAVKCHVEYQPDDGMVVCVLLATGDVVTTSGSLPARELVL